MKKPYLLIAGLKFCSSHGTDDWIDCYETYEKAQEQIKRDPECKGYTQKET